jgi:hypothetical protein
MYSGITPGNALVSEKLMKNGMRTNTSVTNPM